MTSIKPISFGTTSNGEEVELYRLTNRNGVSIDISSYGADIVSLNIPDKTGAPVDVVLGYDNIAQYEVNAPNFGAVVGRHANRIKGARFTLDGVDYTLADTEKGNSLHSGPNMWFKRMWSPVEAAQYDEPQDGVAAAVELHLLSPDGDQGFPGELDIHVRYELTEDNALNCIYFGTPSQKTIVNLTQHSYFNLNGHASGTALDHTLEVNADSYTVCDDTLCPTGEIASVEGTPLDLRVAKPVRLGVESDFAPIVGAKGYDHNFVLPKSGASTEGYLCEPRRVATLTADKTGISCDVWTDTPGIQIYSGNYIEGEVGKGNHTYHDWDAVCLETNFAANAINIPSFDQPVFGPERPYKSITTYAFKVA